MRLLLVLISFLFVHSCKSYKIKNFDNYKTVKTSSTDDVVLNLNKKKSIVVIPFEDTGEYSSKNEIGKAMANLIQQTMEENKYAKIEDRKIITQLKDEISLHEMNSTATSFSGPEVANYAITGKVNYASFSQSSSIDWFALSIKIANQGKGDESIFVPSSRVDINASIKIIELPEMKIVKEIQCKEKAERKVPNDTYSSMTNDGVTMRRAILRCVDKVLPSVFKAIKPYGTIVEKKVHDGIAIFKINIGSDRGLKQGQKIFISRVLEDEKEKVINVNSVYISDKIDENESWIIVKNSEDFMKIKLGDIAYINMEYENRSQSTLADAFGLDMDK